MRKVSFLKKVSHPVKKDCAKRKFYGDRVFQTKKLSTSVVRVNDLRACVFIQKIKLEINIFLSSFHPTAKKKQSKRERARKILCVEPRLNKMRLETKQCDVKSNVNVASVFVLYSSK